MKRRIGALIAWVLAGLFVAGATIWGAQYELVYVGDERDAIRVRTNYRWDPPERIHLGRIFGSIEHDRCAFASLQGAHEGRNVTVMPHIRGGERLVAIALSSAERHG